MANPHIGEIAWEFNDKHYTFKATNRGKVMAEESVDLRGQELQRAVGMAGLDWGQLRTGIFLAVTRKYHAQDFQNEGVINNFLDDFDDAVQEKVEAEGAEAAKAMNIELQASLLAAFNRESKTRMTKMLYGEDPDAEDESPKEDLTTTKDKGKGKAENKTESEAA